MNRRIVLAARPKGEPRLDDFRLEPAPIPTPADGQVLLRTLYLSLDPYMRARMNAGPSYAPPVEIGEVMHGGAVSVVETGSGALQRGDMVVGYTGWQEYATAPPQALRKLDPSLAPVSTALGVLGMPGMTAYTGLLNIGRPRAGETVVVAAASGAVGSVVGQIARLKGCRAVGIAGGRQKCEYVCDELGFDACVDHRGESFAVDLRAACPDGIDVYFENVGGHVLQAVMPLLNTFARIPVCGVIAHANASELPAGPDRLPALLASILTRRLTFRGFLVWDFTDQESDFLRDMAVWLREGRIKYREDVVTGLENAPGSLIGLLRGRNFGKMLVKVG